MKKNIYKILATTFALALVAATPAATMTTHAAGTGMGLNKDAHDDHDYGDEPSSSSSSSGSSSSSSSGSGSSSSSGSSGSGSSSSSGMGLNPNAHDDHDYGDEPSDYWSSSYSGGESYNPTPVGDANWDAVKSNPNDSKANAGKESFRSVMSSDKKQYDVYHKGISVATFIVAGADGKAVQYSNVTVKAGDDGKYYVEIATPAGVDATGFTVALTKGDASYLYTTLGISGIKLNGEISLLTAPTE